MKTTVFFLLLIFLCPKLSAQNCPVNIDFETGDFTNWDCFIGFTSVDNAGKNQIILAPSPPTATRHEIISAANAGKDKYGGFPTLCPYGGNYSVKLGNESTGSQAEGLSYTFVVPAAVDTFTFTYFYAVVFENPGHPTEQQPRFFVTAYDVLTGKLINCASYNYVSTATIPGFQKSTVGTDVLYKNWSPVSIQFAGLANRSVRLEFKTADCTQTGHFGYAYLDVGAGCSNILATAPYCKETNSIILNAPYGFKDYTWYSPDYSTVIGNLQSLTLSPPPAITGVFHVDMIPYPDFGCRDTVDALVTPLPVPDTPVVKPDYNYCQFDPTGVLVATALPGNDLLWYTAATGGVGTTITPIISSAKPGDSTFYVSQKVLFGCESFRKKLVVTILPTPSTTFSINNIRQCQNGNQFIFTSTSSNLDNGKFTWDFGDGQSSSDTNTKHTYLIYGSFTVKLKVVNDSLCTAQKTLPLTVVPKPIAAFNYPATICEQETSVLLTDKSTVPTGISKIFKWDWIINGTKSTVQNPTSFIATIPGPMQVSLAVTTTEGCVSDTNNIMLPIRYRPTAALKFGTLLCENEIIQFTDLSYLQPAAAPENVVKWFWQFDKTINSSNQNPSQILTAGVHTAALFAETNYGCKSVEFDTSFTIFPKPNIQLAINDSCVFRTIKYSATDLLNSTSKWFWDFGNGLYQSSALVTKRFEQEGNNPLTLIGQTANGCKDTIFRPFTIFDNKATAGRDTLVAINQPVLLISHGGPNVNYLWSPSVGLDSDRIENPTATYDRDLRYFLDAVTDKGCDSHTNILVKRFKGPDLFIPTAFTPNGDGLNDVLKVFPVGIKSFTSFAVYDRFGQQIFFTTDFTTGWNGFYKGELGTGNYVAVAKAIDYNGNEMVRKEDVMLMK